MTHHPSSKVSGHATVFHIFRVELDRSREPPLVEGRQRCHLVRVQLLPQHQPTRIVKNKPKDTKKRREACEANAPTVLTVDFRAAVWIRVRVGVRVRVQLLPQHQPTRKHGSLPKTPQAEETMRECLWGCQWMRGSVGVTVMVRVRVQFLPQNQPARRVSKKIGRHEKCRESCDVRLLVVMSVGFRYGVGG